MTSETPSHHDMIVKMRLAQAGVICHLFGCVYLWDGRSRLTLTFISRLRETMAAPDLSPFPHAGPVGLNGIPIFFVF